MAEVAWAEKTETKRAEAEQVEVKALGALNAVRNLISDAGVVRRVCVDRLI